MPHVFSIITPEGEAEIDRIWYTGTEDDVAYFEWIECNTLEAAQSACGEKWDDSVKAHVHDIETTSSMPVALALQIAVWTNPTAGRTAIVDHTDEFEQILYDRIRDRGFSLPFSISVSVVPNPHLKIDEFDFAKDTPSNAKSA